jgi:D-hydroxyproline dehydrogenase subunit beta
MHPDVIVVGAGIAGVCAALELVRRGVHVSVLDRGPVSGGTTGLGEGNVLCSDKRPGPELELALAGARLYDELEAAFPEAAQVRRKGGLILHADAGTWLRAPAFAQLMAGAGVECRLVEANELGELEPAIAPDLAGAVLFGGDLQVAPRELTVALAGEVRRLGGVIHEGTTVSGIAARAGAVTGVETDGGTQPCDTVVLAAGPWSAPLAASAGLKLPVEPRKGTLVQVGPAPGLVRRKLYEAAYADDIVSDDAGLRIAAVIEETLDGHVLCGSSRERAGFDARVDADVCDALVRRATRFVPVLATLPRRAAWCGFRPYLPDHLPAIGPSQAVAGLHVSTGHEGAGIALGPISGRLVAQAICGEPTALELAPFSPDRFQ